MWLFLHMDTYSSSLVKRVVKFCLHSDLSVRVGIDKREPQIGVVSAPVEQNEEKPHIKDSILTLSCLPSCSTITN